MLRTLALPFLATALLVSATNAQNFDLGQRGGGLPGTATWSLSGPVGSPYILLFHVIEQSTPIPTLGITLAIPPDFVDTSLAIPGFTGTLNGAGLASVTIPLPSDLEFAVKVFSLQAVGQDSSTYFTSNLVRMTMQPVGTFAEPLNQPLVPVIGGGVVAEAGGELLLVGGSGPIATRYKSRLEEWETAGASFGIGLFSQTTVLGDGRVLFTGGLDLSTGQPSAAAAIYDPATQVTTTLAMAYVVLFATGVAMITFNALSNGVLQLLVEEQYRGRLMALYSLVFVGLSQAVGSFAMGALARVVTAPHAIAISAVLLMLASLYALRFSDFWRRV